MTIQLEPSLWEGRGWALQIIPGIPFGRHHILPHISQKRQYQVNNNRRTHGKQGSINKILANAGSSYAQSFTNCGAHTEGIPFNKVSESVHGTANLKKSFQNRRMCSLKIIPLS